MTTKSAPRGGQLTAEAYMVSEFASVPITGAQWTPLPYFIELRFT